MKKCFFEKLGIPAKPDCRGNRINSEIFPDSFLNFNSLQAFINKKNRNFNYGHLACFEASMQKKSIL